MNNLLARFAENGFWMARYMERTENLARILDVNESFARDKLGEQEWLPIVNLHADEESLKKSHVGIMKENHGGSIMEWESLAWGP